MDAEWFVNTGSKKLGRIWGQPLGTVNWRMAGDVLKLAFLIAFAPFVDGLDGPRTIHNCLQEHRLIAELAGDAMNDVGGIGKVFAQLFCAQRAFGIARCQNQIMNVRNVARADHCGKVAD